MPTIARAILASNLVSADTYDPKPTGMPVAIT